MVLLDRWGASATAPLDHLACGVVIVDGSGLLRYANSSAGEVLRERGERKGAFFNLRAGCLSGSTADAQKLLYLALRQACAPVRRASAFCCQATGLAGLLVRVVPLEPVVQEPLAAVYFANPQHTVDACELQSLFLLTPAEAATAALLAGGASPEECARLRGTSISTVRSHLRSIFSKSGTQTQTQFVALARCLPTLRA